MTILDSPNTTSATTYQVRFTAGDNAQPTRLGRTNMKSSITLFEIKG
jgi:hypothetical protein